MTAVLIGLLALMTLTICVAALAHRRSGSGSTGGPADDEGGDDGGSQPRVPPQRPSGPCDALDPDWWPEFEREFTEYARGLSSRA